MNDMIRRTDHMTALNFECSSTNSVSRLLAGLDVVAVEEAPAEAGAVGAVDVAAAAISLQGTPLFNNK